MARLQKGHAGLFKMRDVAKSFFRWPQTNYQSQLTSAKSKGCLKSGKSSNSVTPSTEIAKFYSTEEPNLDIQVDFLGPLPHTWFANKSH